MASFGFRNVFMPNLIMAFPTDEGATWETAADIAIWHVNRSASHTF